MKVGSVMLSTFLLCWKACCAEGVIIFWYL